MPEIAGIRGGTVHTAMQVLEKKVAVGEKVIVIGGGLIGVETAEYLADQGKKVILVEMLNAVAADVGFTTRWGLLPRIRKKMEIHTSNRVTEVKEGRVILVDSKGDRREMAADTIVLAAGLKSRLDLVDFLKKSGVEYHVIGSCRTPGQIADAVRDGFDLGCRI
jgi:pyruvate/2-oxoglutarate dehydrogenase complex dihydrolipoamide dehydrogenase (E3) component